jgi:hypothetical protein
MVRLGGVVLEIRAAAGVVLDRREDLDLDDVANVRVRVYRPLADITRIVKHRILPGGWH